MPRETANAIAMRGHPQSRRASELAQRQFGAVARRQLLAAGFTGPRVERWVRGGRLHPVYPGVYALGRPGLSTEGELAAALLFAGAGSALGGLTVLWWRGLLERRPTRIHVDAPGGKRSQFDLRIRHPHTVHRELHRGLPTTPLSPALLTAAPALTHNSLRLVLARAEFNGQLNLAALQTAIADGRRGTRALRPAMEAHLPELARCASPIERTFLLLCEQHALPLPEPNPRIGRYRPDMLWRDARLIVELDGHAAHHTTAQLGADTRRREHLESLGHTVLRFTHAELTAAPARVAAAVRSALTHR